MLKVIDERLLDTKIPNDNEFYKDLIDIDKDSYLKFYSLYYNILLKYFIKKYNLIKYDNILLKYKLPILKTNKMDLYQYLSSDYLNYIYIRNNIHIERLSQDEMEMLVNIYKNNITEEEINIFIENTYKKIILEETKGEYYVFYGANNKKFMCESNSIVIGIRYDTVKSINDNLSKIHEKRVFLLKKIMNVELNKNSDIKFNIINYNNFSVRTRK